MAASPTMKGIQPLNQLFSCVRNTIEMKVYCSADSARKVITSARIKPPMINARVGSMRVWGSLKLTATQVASPITAEYPGENPLSFSAVITTRGMV